MSYIATVDSVAADVCVTPAPFPVFCVKGQKNISPNYYLDYRLKKKKNIKLKLAFFLIFLSEICLVEIVSRFFFCDFECNCFCPTCYALYIKDKIFHFQRVKVKQQKKKHGFECLVPKCIWHTSM